MIASPTDQIPESGIGFPTTKYLDRKVDHSVPKFVSFCDIIIFHFCEHSKYANN